jgi:flagellar motor protein MotB
MNLKTLMILVLTFVWGLICWNRYVCHIKGFCKDQNEKIVDQTNTDGKLPITFDWNGHYPYVESDHKVLVDSFSSLNYDSSMLQITGYYYAHEVGNEAASDLGMARAKALKDKLFPGFSDAKVKLVSQMLSDDTATLKYFPSFDIQKINATSNEVLEVQESADGAVLHFKSGSAQGMISPEIDNYLTALAKEARAKDLTIRVTGHTDDQGSPTKNLQLAYDRAEAIRGVLMKKGVLLARIEVESYGPDKPIADNATEAGRELNRRVEVKKMKSKK